MNKDTLTKALSSLVIEGATILYKVLEKRDAKRQKQNQLLKKLARKVLLKMSNLKSKFQRNHSILKLNIKLGTQKLYQ
jgi:hypothetical protein